MISQNSVAVTDYASLGLNFAEILRHVVQFGILGLNVLVALLALDQVVTLAPN